MIREFSIHAKNTNKKARWAFIVCFLCAFLFLMVSTLIPLYKGVVGLFGMIFLLVAIFLYTKYVSASYYYETVIDSEGTPLFVVRQVTGKRGTTLCRIAFYEIIKVEFESAKEKKEHKTPYGVKKYSYVPTVMPENVCRIYTASRYEKSEVLIEVSFELAQLLSDYAREARENAARLEEEEEY